jgi:hypothetical protein
MAKKKSAFLESLENMDFGRIDMKGVELGGDYSSLQTDPLENKPNLDFKTPKNTKQGNSKIKSEKSPKGKENDQKSNKPKVVRVKSKIIGEKPLVKPKNQASNLEISLDFLQNMTYEVKVEYLALNGWSLHLERYKGVYFEVAQKFIERRKHRIYLKELKGMPNYDDYSKTDMTQIQNMVSTVDKKIYLFKRGWAVKIVTRAYQEYEYAVRYFNRKKKMIYLAPHTQDSTQVFLS